MPKAEVYECKKCGHTLSWNRHLLLYTIGEELAEDEISSYSFVNMSESDCKGGVLFTFCEKCNKIIKFYFISDDTKEEYREKFIEQIKEHINENFNTDMVQIFKEDFNDKYIKCPICKKRLKKEYKFKKCIKCGSEEIEEFTIFSI